jgi:hypothetical protein
VQKLKLTPRKGVSATSPRGTVKCFVVGLITAALIAGAAFRTGAVAGPSCPPPGEDSSVKIFVDNQPVDEVRTVIVAGRVLVPLRGVFFEKIGASVATDDGSQKTIVIHRNTVTITLPVCMGPALINDQVAKGRTKEMDVPVKTDDGHTMVPLRFVSQELGFGIYWHRVATTKTVHITSPLAPGHNPHRDRGATPSAPLTLITAILVILGPLLVVTVPVVAVRSLR